MFGGIFRGIFLQFLEDAAHARGAVVALSLGDHYFEQSSYQLQSHISIHRNN